MDKREESNIHEISKNSITIKITYNNISKVICEPQIQIDTYFLMENFRIHLRNDRTKNIAIVKIFKNNKPNKQDVLILEKACYAIQIQCKAELDDEYVHLLISDIFPINKKIYLLIETYEFIIENLEAKKLNFNQINNKLGFNLPKFIQSDENNISYENQTMNHYDDDEYNIEYDELENIDVDKIIQEETQKNNISKTYTPKNLFKIVKSQCSSQSTLRLLQNNNSKRNDLLHSSMNTQMILSNQTNISESKNLDTLSQFINLGKKGSKIFDDEDELDDQNLDILNKKVKLNNNLASKKPLYCYDDDAEPEYGEWIDKSKENLECNMNKDTAKMKINNKNKHERANRTLENRNDCKENKILMPIYEPITKFGEDEEERSNSSVESKHRPELENQKSRSPNELTQTFGSIKLSESPLESNRIKCIRKKKKLAIFDDEEDDEDFGIEANNNNKILKSSEEKFSRLTHSTDSIASESSTEIKEKVESYPNENSVVSNSLVQLESTSHQTPKTRKLNEIEQENKKLRRLKKLVENKRENQKYSASKGQTTECEEIADKTCAICLCEFADLIGKVDNCMHKFCFTCIKDWAAVTNECPLCKRRFNIIEKLTLNGNKIGSMKVEFKQQVYEYDPTDDIDQDADDLCYNCESGNDPELLLICDFCGFHCCHTYCCEPPLSRIPVGEWFCEYCIEGSNSLRNESQPTWGSDRVRVSTRRRQANNNSRSRQVNPVQNTTRRAREINTRSRRNNTRLPPRSNYLGPGSLLSSLFRSFENETAAYNFDIPNDYYYNEDINSNSERHHQTRSRNNESNSTRYYNNSNSNRVDNIVNHQNKTNTRENEQNRISTRKHQSNQTNLRINNLDEMVYTRRITRATSGIGR